MEPKDDELKDDDLWPGEAELGDDDELEDDDDEVVDADDDD